MKIQKLGLQLYTVRSAMDTPEHIRSTFGKIKELGYDEAQTAGLPLPYEEFAKMAKEEGIAICGTHDSFDRMTEDPDAAMKMHETLGCKVMGIGGFHPKSVEDVKVFIERANKLAKAIKPYGFRFDYHNHSHEFIKMENGKTIMDMLVEELDPEGTSFCLDTCWLQCAGCDVRYWIEKLTGRIEILHLKDVGRNGDGQYITEIGNGNLYWEGIIDTAVKTGIKHFVVEQDYCPGDPFDSIKQSSDYIHKNFM